jgi:folylpolyglutamate synthase/dihydropteroate synthase
MHADVAEALHAAVGAQPMLIAGSLYLAGEAIALIEGQADAFERSAQ